MAETPFRSATVVLGMHRSGTSALAGVLRLCGLASPKSLIPSGAANAKGFWESEPIKALNDGALDLLGLNWHALGQIGPDSFGTRRFDPLRLQARSLLKSEFPARSNIVLKDPRLCRTLPLWKAALDRSSPQLGFALIVRNPLEVAESLAERNDMHLDHALLLWARYILDAELHTRGSRRLFTSFQGLIDDWRATIERLAAALALPVDMTATDGEAVDEYIAPGLRHHTHADEGSLDGRFAQIGAAYRIFSQWAAGEAESQAALEELDRIRAELDSVAAPLSDLLEGSRLDRKRVRSARAELHQVQAELSRSRDSAKKIDELRSALDASFEKLAASLGERAALVASHAQERAALIAGQAEERKAASRREADAQQALAKARGEAEKLAVRVASLERQRRSSEEELGRVKHKYRAAQYDVERERKAHAITKAKLGDIANRLARYEQSAAWRFYLAVVRFWRRALDLAGPLTGASRRQRRELLSTIAGSGLFDGQWYLSEYPDVAAAGLDPLVHFAENGWREGRDPGPSFRTSAYLKVNPDVARTGGNPLLHYIEYGRSEGRDLHVRRASPEASVPAVAHDFSDAAPVFRGALPASAPVRWTRSYRFRAGDPGAFLQGELVVGLVKQADERTALQSEFERLASLSGFGPRQPAGARAGATAASATLVDAWYFNSSGLRTRWHDEARPFVARGYQHDPSTGSLKLVGEALIQSNLDLLDLNLADPYFPVLFVFAAAGGDIRGACLMAFPSLCRGGLHYAELLSQSSDAPDPVREGLLQAVRLEEARDNPERLVRSIAVDGDGADGTTPIFDPLFRTWLEKVAAVAVSDRTEKGALNLPFDVVPTLSILGQLRGKAGEKTSAAVLPIVVAGAEPSQPATLLGLPAKAPASLGKGARGYASPWPCLDTPGLLFSDFGGPAAVRGASDRALTDSELLVPAMGSALAIPDTSGDPLTWLIVPQEWRSGELVQSLRALSLQRHSSIHSIAYLGEPDADAAKVATDLFDGRAAIFPDRTSAIANVATPLVGYLGSGVILHDDRSARFLAYLLEDPDVASAACALVTSERRGKTWHVAVTDAGSIAGTPEEKAAFPANVGKLLWRASYPVEAPPRDLWVARTAIVEKWMQSRPPQRVKTGFHLCTTLVTASYLGAPAEVAPEIRVPPVAPNLSVTATVLFG